LREPELSGVACVLEPRRLAGSDVLRGAFRSLRISFAVGERFVVDGVVVLAPVDVEGVVAVVVGEAPDVSPADVCDFEPHPARPSPPARAAAATATGPSGKCRFTACYGRFAG
jgi:hypothetical protein